MDKFSVFWQIRGVPFMWAADPTKTKGKRSGRWLHARVDDRVLGIEGFTEARARCWAWRIDLSRHNGRKRLDGPAQEVREVSKICRTTHTEKNAHTSAPPHVFNLERTISQRASMSFKALWERITYDIQCTLNEMF